MKRSFADHDGGEQTKAEKNSNSTETSLRIGNHLSANVTTDHCHVKPWTKAVSQHVYSNKPIFRRKLIEKYSTARYNLNTKLVCNVNPKHRQTNGTPPRSLQSGKRKANGTRIRDGRHKLENKFAARTSDSKESVNETIAPSTTFNGLPSTLSDQTKTLLKGTAEPWCTSLLPSNSEQTEFAFSSYSDFCENNNADSSQCDTSGKTPLCTVPDGVPDTDESKVTSTEDDGSGWKAPKIEDEECMSAVDSSTCSANGANSLDKSDSTTGDSGGGGGAGGARWKIVSNNVYRYIFEQYEMEKKIGRRRKKKGRGKPKMISRDPQARYIDPYENFVSDVDEQTTLGMAANDKVGMLMYMGVNRPLFPVMYRNLRALNNNEENDHIVTDFWSEFALSTLVTSASDGKLVKKVFVPVKHPKLRSLVSEYGRECNDAWKDVNLNVKEPTPILIGSSTCRKADSLPEASTIKVKKRRTRRRHLIMPESDYKAYELRSVDKKISELEEGVETKPDISDITDGTESEAEEERYDGTIANVKMEDAAADGGTPIHRPERLRYIPTEVSFLQKYGFKECAVEIPRLDPETIALYTSKPKTTLSPTKEKSKKPVSPSGQRPCSASNVQPAWLARNKSTAMPVTLAAARMPTKLVKEEYAESKPNANAIPSGLASECDAEEGTHYFGNRNCSRTFQTIVNYALRNRTSVFHYKIVKMLDFQRSNNKYFKSCDIVRVVKRDTSAAIDVLSDDVDDAEGTRKSALTIQIKRDWEDMWRRDLTAVMKDVPAVGLETGWKNDTTVAPTVPGKEETKMVNDTKAADDNLAGVFSIVHVKMDQLKSLQNVKWLKVKLNRSKVSLCYAKKHSVRHKQLFEMIYRADLSKKVLCVLLRKEEQHQPATELASLFGVYAFPGLCETVLVGPYCFHEDHKLTGTVMSENGDVLKAHVRMSEEKENVPQTENVGEAISVKWWWSSMKVGFEEMNESYLKFLFSPLGVHMDALDEEKINLKRVLEDHMCFDYEKYVNYRGEPNFVLYHDPNVFSIRDTSKIIRVDISLDNTQTNRLRDRTKKQQSLEKKEPFPREVDHNESEKEAAEIRRKALRMEKDHIQSERIRRLIFRRRRDDLAKMLMPSPKPEKNLVPVTEPESSVPMPLVSVIYKAKDMIELLENNTRDLIGQGVELRKVQKVLLTKYISMLRELSYDTRIVQHGNRFLNEWKLQKSRDKAKLDERLKALQKQVKDEVPSVQEAYQKIESNYHNTLAMATAAPVATTTRNTTSTVPNGDDLKVRSARNNRLKRSGTFSSGDFPPSKKFSVSAATKRSEKKYTVISVKSNTHKVADSKAGRKVAEMARLSGGVSPCKGETFEWMPNINANMLMREEEYITVAPTSADSARSAAAENDEPKVYQDKNGRTVKRRRRRRTPEEMIAAREELLAVQKKKLVARQEMTRLRKEFMQNQARKNSSIQVYPKIEDGSKGKNFNFWKDVPREHVRNCEVEFGPSFRTGPLRKIFTEHSYSYVPLPPEPADDNVSSKDTQPGREEPPASGASTSTSKPAPAPSENDEDPQFRTVVRERDDNCITIDLVENHKAFARVNICKMGGDSSPTTNPSLGVSRLKVVRIIEKMLHRLKTVELSSIPEGLPRDRINALKRTILVRRLQTIIQKCGRQQIGNAEIIEISDDDLDEAEMAAAAEENWTVDEQTNATAAATANLLKEVCEEEETVAEIGDAGTAPETSPCEDSMMVNEIVIGNAQQTSNWNRSRPSSTVRPAETETISLSVPVSLPAPKKMVLTKVKISPPNGVVAAGKSPVTVKNLKIVQLLRPAVAQGEGTIKVGAGIAMPLVPTNLKVLTAGVPPIARQVIKVPSDFLKNIAVTRKVTAIPMKETFVKADEKVCLKPKWYAPTNAEEAHSRPNGVKKFYMGLGGVILNEEKDVASAAATTTAAASERKLGIRSFAGFDRFNENLPANIEKLLIAKKQE